MRIITLYVCSVILSNLIFAAKNSVISKVVTICSSLPIINIKAQSLKISIKVNNSSLINNQR